MKKIINNKVYDTDTARAVGSWANMEDAGDLAYLEETLYRKKTGEFFLRGEGGPATRYARATGSNEWSGGARIMPLTYDDARAWAEEHLTGEAYEAVFGPVAEDESRMQVCYNLSVSAAETIRRRAAELGISASAYIETLLH